MYGCKDSHCNKTCVTYSKTEKPGGGGTCMLRYTGMYHRNGLVFHKKSIDMDPIFVKKSLSIVSGS